MSFYTKFFLTIQYYNHTILSKEKTKFMQQTNLYIHTYIMYLPYQSFTYQFQNLHLKNDQLIDILLNCPKDFYFHDCTQHNEFCKIKKIKRKNTHCEINSQKIHLQIVRNTVWPVTMRRFLLAYRYLDRGRDTAN